MPKKDPEREQSYAEKLSVLVRYETESRIGEIQRDKFLGFHKILEEMFPLVHEKLEKTEIDGNLLYYWEGKNHDKPLVLMGHQDVVPAEGSWEHAPYSGDIAEGKVWGRGSADTKCSIMAFLQAVEELLEAGFVPEQDVYLSSSCTEEVSGPGCPQIVEELKRRGVTPYLVNDEGGAIITSPIAGVQGNFAMVGILEKGLGNLKITAKSHGGHSSYPPKNSPIVRLGRFVSDLDKHPVMKSRFNPQSKAMFSNLAPYGKFYLRYLFENIWLFAPLLTKLLPVISPQAAALLRTTVAPTMQSGSEGANVLPQEASLVLNLRYIPHQDMDESNELIRSFARKYDLDMEVMNAYPACTPVDSDSEAFHLVRDVIGEVFPDLPVVPYVMTGGTDARFYQPICNACIRFSPVVYGQEQMKGMHGINECVETSSLPGAVDYYKLLIRKNV